MAEFLMFFTNGLVMGVINAISAMGVSLVVGIMRVINFAHGEMYIFGGYLSYQLAVEVGMSPVVSMVCSVVAVFLGGLAVEKWLIRPTYSDEMYSLIITFILSIILQNAALLIFGPYPLKPPALVSGATSILGLFHYGNQRLLSLALAVGMILAVMYLVRKTWFGKSVRAISQDREMAAMVGVDHLKVNMISFGLGCALAASAGVIIAPIFPVTPSGSSAISLTAFVVVVLGGMGSLKGCAIGGMLLGVLENLGAAYISTDYRHIFAFIILIGVLVLRPWGLFGKRI